MTTMMTILLKTFGKLFHFGCSRNLGKTDRDIRLYPLGEKSRLTFTTVSSTLKSLASSNHRAAFIPIRCNFRVEEAAVTVSRLFPPKGYRVLQYVIYLVVPSGI